MKQKQEKQVGYCARGISSRLMLNLTRTRPSFFVFNYKVKTKLASRRRTEGEAASSCAAAQHCCPAGPGVIVQLEFTSSPLEGGDDDSLPQSFRKCGSKNSIFKRSLATYMPFPNGSSLLAILEWIRWSPVLHKAHRCETLLQAQWNHSQRLGASCKHRAHYGAERRGGERPRRCWLLQGT